MSFPIVKLGDIYDISSSKRVHKEDWRNEGIPFYRAREVVVLAKNGFVDNELFIEESLYNEYSNKYGSPSEGDLLVSAVGTLGKVYAVKANDKFYFKDASVIWLKKKVDVDTTYIRFALSSPLVQKYIQNYSGATVGTFTISKAKNTEIPLPPLPVQKQIAAVLEKADTLRGQCQRMEQELNTLAQSVFLDMFGDPVTNPKGFEVVPLGQLSSVKIGPFGTMLHKSDYVTGGIPLINPTHIKKSRIKPKSDLTITKAKYDELPQYHLEEGDIIMGRRGEMGRCAIVEGASVGYFCGTGSLFIRPNIDVLRPRFINDLLSSDPIKSWFEEQSLGATMANLNKGIVNSVPVPLPDLSTQVRYEQVLNNVARRLKNHSDLKQEIDDNFNSLMQRAFKGELALHKTKDVA